MPARITAVESDRRKYDEDDRNRCKCVHNDGALRPGGKHMARCLNPTRHPSGYCTDCRVYGGRS